MWPHQEVQSPATCSCQASGVCPWLSRFQSFKHDSPRNQEQGLVHDHRDLLTRLGITDSVVLDARFRVTNPPSPERPA